MQVDKPEEHVAVDAAEPYPARRMIIEPDRHGLTIRLEGSHESLIVDLEQGDFYVYSFYQDDQTSRRKLLTILGASATQG